MLWASTNAPTPRATHAAPLGRAAWLLASLFALLVLPLAACGNGGPSDLSVGPGGPDTTTPPVVPPDTTGPVPPDSGRRFHHRRHHHRRDPWSTKEFRSGRPTPRRTSLRSGAAPSTRPPRPTRCLPSSPRPGAPVSGSTSTSLATSRTFVTPTASTSINGRPGSIASPTSISRLISTTAPSAPISSWTNRRMRPSGTAIR